MLRKRASAKAPIQAHVLPFASSRNQLPPVDQIQGVQLQRSAVPSQRKVFIEYTDCANEWHELEMPLPDAMYLMTLLHQIERECGFMPLEEPLPDE